MRDGPFGLIGEQQLEDHFARLLRPLAGAAHLHAFGRHPVAGGGQNALAFDLHHAGAAIAIRAIAGLRLPAQMRDVRSRALGGLPDGFAGLCLDLNAIKFKGDRFAHRKSSGKNLSTDRSGLGAA